MFEVAGAKTGLFSLCLFLQEQTKLKAWVHGDDMCLEGQRGVARALESKLKELMKIGWTKADDKTIPLLNRLMESRVEKGERVLRFERLRDMCKLRYTIWALTRKMPTQGANDSLVKMSYQWRRGQSSDPPQCV